VRSGAIAASILLLVALHVLPRVRRKRGGNPVLLLAIVFLLAQLGISVTIAGLRLQYDILPGRMVKYLAELPTDRPLILLVGSSVTQYGIDRDLLAARLAAAGHPVSIGRLGFGGLSLAERLHYVKEYLSVSRHRPSLVLFEISRYYDVEPLRQLQQNLYSDQEIAGMDFTTAWLNLEWIVAYNGQSFADRIELARGVIGHFLLNAFHIGFAAHAIREARVKPQAFDWEPPKSEVLGDAYLARLLAVVTTPFEEVSQMPVPSPWVAHILDREIGLFRDGGASAFGFYQPPTTYREEYAYGAQFCAAMGAYPCILAGDPKLLADLKHDADWYDRNHLIDEGRRLYTLWFADRLLEKLAMP
jgi:hypothetical protein